MNGRQRHQGFAIVALAMLIAVPASGCGSTGLTSAPTEAPASPVLSSPPARSSEPSTSIATSIIRPVAVEAEPALERVWSGVGPAGATHAAHPSVDPDGRIWVLANLGADSRFWIFDRDGTFIEAWGTPGAGDGEFDFRRGSDIFGSVAFMPDGSFYVAESGNHRVQHFGPDRAYLGRFGEFGTGEDQFVSPNLLKVAGDSVYINDDDLGVIKQFRSDGTFVRTYPSGYPFFDVDDRGHVYAVADDLVLREFEADGSAVRGISLAGLVSFVSGVEVDDRGHIWIGSNREDETLAFADRLLELDADGRLLHDRRDMAIDGLALDPAADRLYAGFFAPDLLVAYTLPAE